MKVVFASDSFKGSLSSKKICELLERAALEVLPDVECVSLLMADGGEGTLDVIRKARSGKDVPLYAHDGMNRKQQVNLFVSNGEVFIESAAICGLAMCSKEELDPLATTSSGVGELIGHALSHGCRRISVGLGGTCTNDGGMGCLHALGIRFFDRNGNELSGCGEDLSLVASIDEGGLLPQLGEAEITAICDVGNPLLGQNGASHVFGPQKGASGNTVERLEAGMRNFANAISRTHPDVDFDTPGFGAAGGLGMALSVFLGAKLRSGIETLLDWVDFDAAIENADLVVTGEGRLDEQSLQGKVIAGIAAHAKRKGIPVAAICGKVALDGERLDSLGLDYVIETSSGQSLEDAMAHAEENYRRVAHQMFRAYLDSR